MIIGVVGGGAWGTALAYTILKSGNKVILWGFNGVFDETLNIKKTKDIKYTSNINDLQKCEYFLIAVPAEFFRETIRKMKSFYKNQPMLICAKGIEKNTWQFMSEILKQEIPTCRNIGVLSGPQFASEVVKNVPTGSTLSGNKNIRAGGHAALSGFYLQDSNDVIGTEICGVGKNAIALISGYLSVKSTGENERALIFTNAWNEIVDFGVKMGGDLKTFLGLCGIGDLFLSAASKTSRNFSAGVAIACGKKVTGTTEGISALQGLIIRGKKIRVKMPTLCEISGKMGI